MFDLIGIGNAIVDTDVEIDDVFLQDESLPKGQMTLIDSSRMAELVDHLGSQTMRRCSGGSAANTIYAAQAFGLNTSYVCQLADDENGRHFFQEMQDAGIVTSQISALEAEQRSGQCLVLVTPDGQRTMCTDLGVSKDFGLEIVNESNLREARCLYIEGYLSSSKRSSQTAAHSTAIARASGSQVALTLSDISMIESCRDGLSCLLGNGVDILFCNADEALAWAKTDRLDVAVDELKDIAKELYVTMGSDGAKVCTSKGHWQINSDAVIPVDTNGAGDMFAGACLAARLKDASATEAAGFANRAAARVITQFGARLPNLAAYHQLRTTA